MASKIFEAILEALEQRGPVRRSGKGFTTRCPVPGHDDREPSFFLYPGGGGKCYSRCARYWEPREMAELLGIETQRDGGGLTLATLAEAKGLSEDFLKSVGVTDGFLGSGGNRRTCVDIPYADETGEIKAVRKRLSMDGRSRFCWRRGDHATLYGLSFLRDVRRSSRVILVEGEIDCWILWKHHLPALGVPGASTWQSSWASYLEGLEVYVWLEDQAGEKLVQDIAKDVPEVRLQDPETFKDRILQLMNSARPFSSYRAEANRAEAAECLSIAGGLLNDPKLLDQLKTDIRATGYAGDPRPALMTYFAITSRLLRAPLNLGYISQSTSGKNAGVDASLPFFPKTAFYLVRASSPRALIYNDEDFEHRLVIMTEADSIPEDGPAASAVRSLMSDGEMTYEVVERGSDGSFHVRKIVKPGPTGLITTSTRPLGDQASTRTLTVSIPDSP